MTLKKIDLCDRVFEKFLKQIKEDSIYLIKYDDKWLVSDFYYCEQRCPELDMNAHRLNPHHWDISLGGYTTQVSCRSEVYMDKNFQEIYEIIDPDLIMKKAKKELLK